MMSGLKDLWFRLRAFFGRDRMDREFTEEAGFHLEMATRELIQSGMDPQEARRQAQIAFGGVEVHRERARDARGTRALEDLFHDVRFGFRVLRRRPVFTAVAIAALALGIGATTTVYSVIDGILFPDLPFLEPDRLVTGSASVQTAQGEWRRTAINHDQYTAWRDGSDFTRDISIYNFANMTLWSDEGPEELTVGEASPSFLSLLGASPIVGRWFLPGESGP